MTDVLYRVYLTTGEVLDVVRPIDWDLLLAALSERPREWIRLPSGTLVNPQHVTHVEVFASELDERCGGFGPAGLRAAEECARTHTHG